MIDHEVVIISDIGKETYAHHEFALRKAGVHKERGATKISVIVYQAIGNVWSGDTMRSFIWKWVRP